MDKKAQNPGQVLIYVLAIVIVSVIMIFGYRSIMEVKNRTDMMLRIEFQKKIESSIKSITSEFGRMRTVDFDLSNEYKAACFVRNDGTTIMDPTPFEDYPIILDSIDAGNPTKNIFLIKNKKEVAEGFEIGKIRFKDDTEMFKCINVKFSKLTLKIEGKGNYAVIS